MGAYYVSTTGNDTTGDGSASLPWATCHKAITTVTDNEAHTVNIAAGMYAENSGSGYLNILQNRSAVLTLQSASGDPEDVVITGTSGDTYSILFGSGTNAKIKFQDVTFRNRADTTQYCVALHGNSVLSDVEFDHCIFEVQIGGNANTKNGLYCALNDLKTVQGLTVNDCLFRTTGTRAENETVRAVSLTRADAGATLDDITFTNNRIACESVGVIFGAITNLTCTGNLVQTTEGVALTCGFDSGTTNQDTTGTVSSNAVSSVESHGLLLGNGCNGVICENNRVYAGDYGVVIKNSANVKFRGNLCIGSSETFAPIYVKASAAAVVADNISICVRSGGWCLRVGEDTTHSTLYNGVIAQGNLLLARNGAHIYNWGPNAEETGTDSVCDANTLILIGSGTFGAVKADASCATLAEVRTAWDGYGTGGNDDRSVEGVLEFYGALGAVLGGGGMGIGL